MKSSFLPCTLAAMVLLAFSLGGCAEERLRAPTIAMDLSRPRVEPAPTIPLAEVPLASQEDCDGFETGSGAGLSSDAKVQIYEAMLVGQATAAQRTLWLLRIAVLRLEGATGRAGLTRAFGAVERLKEASPDAAHTLYMMARIKEMLLTAGSADRTFALTPQNRDVAEQLLADWERLGDTAPDYQGPHGFDAERRRGQVAELRASLAVASVPDAALTAPSAAVPLAPALVQARRLLWEFMAADDVGRLTLCRDRQAPGGETQGDALLVWLDFTCAVHTRDEAGALGALRKLIATGASTAPCESLRTLKHRFPSMTSDHPAVLDLVSTIRSAGHSACDVDRP